MHFSDINWTAIAAWLGFGLAVFNIGYLQFWRDRARMLANAFFSPEDESSPTPSISVIVKNAGRRSVFIHRRYVGNDDGCCEGLVISPPVELDEGGRYEYAISAEDIESIGVYGEAFHPTTLWLEDTLDNEIKVIGAEKAMKAMVAAVKERQAERRRRQLALAKEGIR